MHKRFHFTAKQRRADAEYATYHAACQAEYARLCARLDYEEETISELVHGYQL